MIHKGKRQLKHEVKDAYQVILDIRNTRKEVLDIMKDVYGGSIHQYDNNGSKLPGKSKPVWAFTIASRQAMKMITDIEPYIILKKQQIKTVKEFQLLLINGRNQANQVTKEENFQRELLYQKMKALNKRGI